MAPRKLFTIEKVAVDPKKSAKAKAAAKGKKGAVAAAGWCIPSPGGAAGCALVRVRPGCWQLARGRKVCSSPVKAAKAKARASIAASKKKAAGEHRTRVRLWRAGCNQGLWWRRAVPCPPEKRKAKRKASAAKRAAKKKAAAAKKAEKAKAKKAKRAAKKAAKAAKKAAKKKAKKAKKPKKAAKK